MPLIRLGHWACVQLGSAIICACLPTYRALLPKGSFSSAKAKKWYSSRPSRPRKSPKPSNSDSDLSGILETDNPRGTRHDHYLNIEEGNDSMVMTTAVGGRDHEYHKETVEKDLPKNFITVRKDVEVFG